MPPACLKVALLFLACAHVTRSEIPPGETDEDDYVDINLPYEERRKMKEAKEAKLPVDIVYCWAGPTCKSTHNDWLWGCDNGELRMSLKLVEKHAPWINAVYVLVNSDVATPTWASELTGIKKLEFVDRCKLFDANETDSCPTYNSHACHAVMHRIPELTEKFVYMDDDIFFATKIEHKEFFLGAKPLMYTGGGANAPQVYESDERYNKRCKPMKMFANLDCPPSNLPRRLNKYAHLPMPMLKSFAEKMEKEYSEFYAFVRKHTVRWTCCLAVKDLGITASGSSKFENGLEEDFTRIYPAMLRYHKKGVPYKTPDGACNDLKCFDEKMREHFFVNFNDATPDTWAKVEQRLNKRLSMGIEELTDEEDSGEDAATACSIKFTNEAGDDVDLLYGDKKDFELTTLETLKDGTMAQFSVSLRDRFALRHRGGKHETSNTVGCKEGEDNEFVLDRNYQLTAVSKSKSEL